jgi:hypothetical protein
VACQYRYEAKGFVMSNVRVVVFSVLVLALAWSASAEAGDWGFAAGSFDGEFGLQARKDFHLGGDISGITGQGSVLFSDPTAFALDADYHFVIKSGTSRFYPLAGLHFIFDSDNAKFGANGGGGINFMLTEKLAAFGEIKYVFGGREGWFFTAGIYF